MVFSDSSEGVMFWGTSFVYSLCLKKSKTHDTPNSRAMITFVVRSLGRLFFSLYKTCTGDWLCARHKNTIWCTANVPLGAEMRSIPENLNTTLKRNLWQDWPEKTRLTRWSTPGWCTPANQEHTSKVSLLGTTFVFAERRVLLQIPPTFLSPKTVTSSWLLLLEIRASSPPDPLFWSFVVFQPVVHVGYLYWFSLLERKDRDQHLPKKNDRKAFEPFRFKKIVTERIILVLENSWWLECWTLLEETRLHDILPGAQWRSVWARPGGHGVIAQLAYLYCSFGRRTSLPARRIALRGLEIPCSTGTCSCCGIYTTDLQTTTLHLQDAYETPGVRFTHAWIHIYRRRLEVWHNPIEFMQCGKGHGSFCSRAGQQRAKMVWKKKQLEISIGLDELEQSDKHFWQQLTSSHASAWTKKLYAWLSIVNVDLIWHLPPRRRPEMINYLVESYKLSKHGCSVTTNTLAGNHCRVPSTFPFTHDRHNVDIKKLL